MKKGMPRGPFKSLVVLGESNVQGGPYVANDDERWPDLLWHQLETAQEQPLKYHNAGVGASVISQNSPGYADSCWPCAADRLDDEVIAHRPDLLVIAYGLNDMRAGMRVAEFERDLRDLIARVRRKLNPMIVLANVYYQTAYHYYAPFDRGSVRATERYNVMLRRVADKFGCVYSDIYSAMAADHLLHLDCVHANKIGCMVVANKVFESVVHAATKIGVKMDARDAKTQWSRDIRKHQRKATKKPKPRKR